jgi:hypothetical protein
MGERARVVGATLDIVSQPGQGTTVRLRGPAELPPLVGLADAPADTPDAEEMAER